MLGYEQSDIDVMQASISLAKHYIPAISNPFLISSFEELAGI